MWINLPIEKGSLMQQSVEVSKYFLLLLSLMAVKVYIRTKDLITSCCIYLIASLSSKVFESAFDVTSNHAKGTRQGGSVFDRVGTGLLVICLEKNERNFFL